MYHIIKRYCESEHTNGLLLLDMATGAGKTHSVIKYIFDAAQDPSVKRKFFFITTLKKNLPEKDLKDLFEKAGQLTQFNEKVLWVDSNYESVIDGFEPEITKTIPFVIKKTDEYKALEQYVNLVKNLRSSKSSALRSALKGAEDSLRKEAEPRFRKMLEILLAKKYPKVEDKLQAIKTESEWQWVAALYPVVFMRDRQIIFMSMDKFLSSNSTIVEPATMLYNSSLIENAVIFIDEFDATKETILNNIIQNGLRDRIDYIEFFNAVYSVLRTHSFPTALTTPSRKRQEGQYKNQSLLDVLNNTAKIAKEIYDSFSLQYSFKTETVTDDSANNFLFQDHQYHSILNGNKSYITVATNPRLRINSINFSKERPETDEGNIQSLLGQLRGFITYFMFTVRILAINYQQCKLERRKPNEDEFTLEEAIRTVLSEFKLTNAQINYLTSQILVSSHKYKGDIQSTDFDVSFYEKGFRYFAFEDSYAHDTQSKIMMYSFQLTPEKLLLRFCEKAKVLGISATATLPSAIGNYDMEYVAEKLQHKYVEPNNTEKARLKDELAQSVKGYDKVNIHAELIGTSSYSVEAWKEVVDNEEVAQYLFDHVAANCQQDYDKERYLRIAIVFKRFLLEERIQSFLCILTKHPRKNDRTLNLDVLCFIFDCISKFYRAAFDVQKNVVQLDGDEYDSKKNEIIGRLGKGDRLFVISVYQTIGAGQNLQYPVPKGRMQDLVVTNDRPNRGEKDFDAIYLDKPTNLITLLTPDLTEENFVKHLFHVEMLQENGEVSPKDATSNIKNAFRCLGQKKERPEFTSNINNCPGVIRMSTRVIIQAVGRMCRTNLKSKDIFVFADNRIVDRIDHDACENRLLNLEFTELLKALSAVKKTHEVAQDETLSNKAQVKSIRANKYINSMLHENWTDNRIACWKQLREMALTHPTLSADQFDDKGIAYNYYVELPRDGNRVFFKEDDDFNNVQVFFDRVPGAQELSAELSKLTSLMQIDFLRKHFENHGWATSFTPNRFIMSPPLFNNIYRGALGEVAGKALFYRLAGVELLDIEDNALFEKFDYIVPNASICVDFKNWHESSFKESDAEISHIANKAKECGCRCVIIANIIAEGNWSVREQTIDGVKVVIVPALLTNNEVPTPVHATWEKIRRWILEYSN